MKKIYYFGFALMSLVGAGCASSKYHQANYEYSNMAYYKASKKYAAYLAHHNKPIAVFRLADCYRKMNDFQSAEYWYSRAVTLPGAMADHKLAYAMALKANGKYDLAKQAFEQYLVAMPSDQVAKAQMISCDSFDAYNANIASYRVAPLPIAENVNAFGMTPFESGFVFCAQRSVTPDGKNNAWDGRPYLNMLYTQALPDGKFTDPASLSGTLNSPYYNGPLTFTNDYKRVYFSSSNQANGKLLKNADKVNNIKLYTAWKSGNDWTAAWALPFNNNDYSCGQPTLSVTGDTLFFISDKPGGNGKTDIYMSVNNNGSWSAPINLGTNINTPGAEMFPNYVHDKNGKSFLYFSSDGLPGMGGLDLYCAQQLPDGTWGVPVHMDAPLNSSKDDFNLILNADGTGYFSSSRDEDKDKLFMFSRITEVFAKVAVHDRKTNELLISALVEINNQTTGKKELLYTDSTGKLYIPLTRDALYAFNATKENFVPGQSFASTFGEKGGETIEVRIDLETPPPPPPPVALHLIALPAAISNVYFDVNKSNIRSDANPTLDKLTELMLKDPAMKLDINAHADARGSDQLNMALTKKRAMAVVEYLANAGISRDRLNPRWFGKTQLVIEDSPKDADDTHHQLNRRVEFKQIEEKPALHSDVSYTNYH